MPAAAVIPAPLAYIKVVAVKKLVVELLGQAGSSALVVREADCLILAGKAQAFTCRRPYLQPLL